MLAPGTKPTSMLSPSGSNPASTRRRRKVASGPGAAPMRRPLSACKSPRATPKSARMMSNQ